jgi:hypothetical protein
LRQSQAFESNTDVELPILKAVPIFKQDS